MVAKFEYLASRSATALLRLAEVARVAEALRGGGLAVLPTETGYMLAALATDEQAILRAFQVKGRGLANTMHIACSSLEMARGVAWITPTAARLLGELTPGPITVVVNQTPLLPPRLVTVNGTVGIRVPDHPATLQIIDAVGSPITATSLNRAGEPPRSIDRHDLELLDWPAGSVVHVVEDDSSIRYTSPSTLVRVTGPDPEILRAGPITESAIRVLSYGPSVTGA
jgi:L-threonylcarbamoyladenylate synthase